MAKAELLFALERNTNIATHIRWFNYLSSDDFQKKFRSRYESKDNREKLTELSRQVIQSEVYSKNTTKGTGRILQSFTARRGKDKRTPSIFIFSRPSTAPSKAGKQPGKFSYAAFFEKPIEFKSFIKSDDLLSSVRYRPFMSQMAKIIHKESAPMSRKAFMESTRHRQPKSGIQ